MVKTSIAASTYILTKEDKTSLPLLQLLSPCCLSLYSSRNEQLSRFCGCFFRPLDFHQLPRLAIRDGPAPLIKYNSTATFFPTSPPRGYGGWIRRACAFLFFAALILADFTIGAFFFLVFGISMSTPREGHGQTRHDAFQFFWGGSIILNLIGGTACTRASIPYWLSPGLPATPVVESSA